MTVIFATLSRTRAKVGLGILGGKAKDWRSAWSALVLRNVQKRPRSRQRPACSRTWSENQTNQPVLGAWLRGRREGTFRGAPWRSLQEQGGSGQRNGSRAPQRRAAQACGMSRSLETPFLGCMGIPKDLSARFRIQFSRGPRRDVRLRMQTL